MTPSTSTVTVARGPSAASRVQLAGVVGLLVFVGALQVSIAAASIVLALTIGCWAAVAAVRPEQAGAPRFVWPLLVYAALTLVSAAASYDSAASFVDSKQLVLFLIVPMTYQFARGARAMTVLQVVITVGAASAAFGIVQYGLLNYNNLGQRPQGAMGHYMTYSGLLLLVLCAAVARLLFEPQNRGWPAVVLPALLVAIVLTFTRSAWVGACAGVALLLAMKDFRLLPILPVAAAVFFAISPPQITARFYSMFDLKDPTSRDRVAMLKEGVSMIRAHPLTGVGPNMVERLYEQYRDPSAVEKINPHLHNVPMQIAAERGLPALAAWLCFVAIATIDLARLWRRSRFPCLPATALAATASMVAAGLFEYNFGDSEFLMLYLVLLTLPFSAGRPEAA